MDNVTHTLLGIAAAEAFATTRPKKARVPLWIASAVANNLPDLDVLFTWSRHGDKLDYLLHHRGYTHTILLAPLEGLLWLAALRFVWRKRTDIPWKEVAWLCLLGPLLHLLADSWNSYGVHPFWPLSNRWVYGDLIFIVEPWIWALFLPLVWKRAGTAYGKGLALLLLALVLGTGWRHPYVTWPVALALTICSLSWVAAQRWIADDRKRLSAALAGLFVMFSFFMWAEHSLRARFRSVGSEIAMLAHPGNPFCWTVMAAGFRGDDYRAAVWTASPWPSAVPPDACPKLFRAENSAGLSPIQEAAADFKIPIGEFRGTRAQYREATKSCRARAFLRFARIPFWKLEGGKIFLGDLRFDRDRSLSFAEVSAGAPAEVCPAFEPPWVGRFSPSEL